LVDFLAETKIKTIKTLLGFFSEEDDGGRVIRGLREVLVQRASIGETGITCGAAVLGH
jgi:hypothetical protein